ncbi:MAG: hypothetical protein ACOC97_01880 [Myxococcota bacterium]
MKRVALLLAALGATGCADVAQERVQVPLSLAGTDLSAPVTAEGDVPVTVERADLAFGPLYLCAGSTAGDLCDTARLEWLETAVVDAASAEPVPVGELSGLTGPVRSWMYDLGISSQLTHTEPVVLEAAEMLGGVSFVVEGVAEVEGQEVPFSAAVPVRQTDETELGVPVVRKSANETFGHEVAVDEPGLLVRFDAAAWIGRIDFRAYVEDASCAPDGPPLVCAGAVEQVCDEAGDVVDVRDCSDLDQVCVAGVGCADGVVIEPGTDAFRRLRNALVAGDRPTFEWGVAP